MQTLCASSMVFYIQTAYCYVIGYVEGDFPIHCCNSNSVCKGTFIALLSESSVYCFDDSFTSFSRSATLQLCEKEGKTRILREDETAMVVRYLRLCCSAK